jgi:long-chain acyl-CoA synthetase
VNVVDRLLGTGGHDRQLALLDDGAASGASAPGALAAVTYGELAALVDDTAQRLRATGVVAAADGIARIGVAAPNGIAHVVLALAVLRAGGCVVPVAGELAPPERRALLRALHPRAVLVADGVRWDDPADGATVTTLAVAGTAVRVVRAQCGEAEARSPHDEPAIAALDPAFVRFSSGTTGASKGVVLSHRTLVARITAANRGLGICPADRILWTMPMAHHFAASIMLYLAQRATTVLARGHVAADLLATARRHDATVLYAAPFHYALLAAESSRDAWPSLRLAVSTAAALPIATARAFAARYGVPVAQALGIIEAGLVTLNDRPRDKPEDVGRPLPDFTAEIRDECGRALGAGDVGELHLRGPGMLDGYLWPLRPRAEILSDGWFATGDLARADDDGSLRLLGRTRSVINVSGLKCFPEEIEAVLLGHPQVGAARVVGRPHDHLGAVPVADVVPRDAARPPDARGLAAHCRAALARCKVPVEFRVVPALPLTASGKVKR